jgi:pectinesterase
MENFSQRAKKKTFVVGRLAYCDFSTIQAAINASDYKTTIIILAGRYEELLTIYQDGIHLVGVGDVVVSQHLSAYEKDAFGQVLGTFQTATVFVNADDVIIENLTIENTAGPGEQVGQAVALYVEGTNFKAKQCQLLAEQDTLCLGPLPELNKDGTPMLSPKRQKRKLAQVSYFNHCHITGTVDFIFGGGTATFHNCELEVLARPDQLPSFITAASTSPQQPGFYFIECFIHGASPYYLGRPWRNNAKVRYESCWFDANLEVSGWDDWDKPESQATVQFKEFQNHYQAKPLRPAWVAFLN